MVELNKIPSQPGCYFFLNETGKILYIGKAKNLKKRVQNYFQSRAKDGKTEVMLSQVRQVDFIVTDNEVEALILESNLIKKNMPRYNIDLKDAKYFSFLRLTDEPFPALLISRNRHEGGELFGPYVSAVDRDFVKNVISKAFMIRTCRRLPKRACLRYHIHLCSAPCIHNISPGDYQERIKMVRLVLKGKVDELIGKLEEKMAKASVHQRYEDALAWRNQINALRSISRKQKMDRKRTADEDIVNYFVKDNDVYLWLFNVEKGILKNKQEFHFPFHRDFLEEFLRRFYEENLIPGEIIVPAPLDPSIAEYFSQMKGKNVKIKVPRQGEKKQLLLLIAKNLEILYASHDPSLDELKEALDLPAIPVIIECFDISQLSGTDMVGSLVRFANGRPDKSNYRRFKIKSVDRIDDVAAMAEVVGRRYRRLVGEGGSFPDLIVIDGGIGQLQGALGELEKNQLEIPVIALAKRLEEIYRPDQPRPLVLKGNSRALHLLQRVRDEAHRFAVNYHRWLRHKRIKNAL